MSANHKPDIRLTVTATRDKFIATAVYLVEPSPNAISPNDAGIRNPSDHDDEPLASLANFGIGAYRDPDFNDGAWFGFSAGYMDCFRVDQRQAERMVKLLRRINAKLAKLDEMYGASEDLAAYCGRVAQAIGVRSSQPFAIRHRELRANGTHYQFTSVDGLRNHLARVNETRSAT